MRRLFFGFVAGSVALAVSLYGLRALTQDAAGDDPKLFANRIWAERTPRNERDMVLYLMPIEVGSKRPGLIERSSRYAHGGERFTWKRDGDKLVMDMPQEQRTVKLGLRTWSCKGEAPDGFDLCMELQEGNQKLRLYSRKAWRVPKGEDLPEAFAGRSLADGPEMPADACAACEPAGLEALVALEAR